MGLACPLVVLLLQCRSILCLNSGERTFTLVFLQRIIIAATVSFGRPYASRICSIFPLCMESKALVKSTEGFLPVCLQGFYGCSIFVKLWIYFFGSHFGFS